MLQEVRDAILREKDPEKGVFLQRFFKTGKGQYGEGDIFYGLTVPISRSIANHFKELSLNEIGELIKSKVHEERLIALLILVEQFKKSDENTAKEIFDFYLAHTKYINNWDLVDLSADKIVGEYLKTRDRSILQKLATSELLWERRISIIATFQFIKDLKEYEETFAVADILLLDKHDLIQKAVGWMLREVGKRVSREVEEEFLLTRYKNMPRTMLRYSIEHFPPERRKHYLQGLI